MPCRLHLIGIELARRLDQPARFRPQIAAPFMKQIMDLGEAQRATRSEAIHRLVELGLSKSAPSGRLQSARSAAHDTPVDRLRLPTRIKKVLAAEGLKTVGEVRDTPDSGLLSFQDFGAGSVAHLRETLGLASKDGVRQSLAAGLNVKK